MKVKDRDTGKIIDLGNSAYEVSDAFIVPLRCLYKEHYELIEDKEDKIEEKR